MADIRKMNYRANRLLVEREAAIRQLIQSGHTSTAAMAAIDDYFERQLVDLIGDLEADLGYADAVYQTFGGRSR